MRAEVDRRPTAGHGHDRGDGEQAVDLAEVLHAGFAERLDLGAFRRRLAPHHAAAGHRHRTAAVALLLAIALLLLLVVAALLLTVALLLLTVALLLAIGLLLLVVTALLLSVALLLLRVAALLLTVAMLLLRVAALLLSVALLLLLPVGLLLLRLCRGVLHAGDLHHESAAGHRRGGHRHARRRILLLHLLDRLLIRLWVARVDGEFHVAHGCRPPPGLQAGQARLHNFRCRRRLPRIAGGTPQNEPACATEPCSLSRRRHPRSRR